MPRAYSEDLHRWVVADVDKGLSIRAVADKYSVSPLFASKITCLWRQEGERFPAQDRGLFLDETGAGTDMTRRHGRCPVGERCHDHAPGGHWKTMTFVAGLHLDGLVAP